MMRSARRMRLCTHLHAAGPRPVLEALIAVDSGQPRRRRQLFPPTIYHQWNISMNVAEKIDYSLIPVIDVARELLGQETRESRTANERRFPDHGGLFVNLKKNKWYCHGESTGGDAISLIRFCNGCDYKAAFDWLRSRESIHWYGIPEGAYKCQDITGNTSLITA